MYKIIFTISLFVFICSTLKAQNVGIGTPSPAASAKLDISSTNSGLLIPRISLNDVTDGLLPIAAPETGVLVFNTNAGITGGSGTGFYYWDGTIWARMEDTNFSGGGGGSGWQLNGNGGTNPINNFVGTTDAQDLIFRTNNTEKMRVRSDGRVEIGGSISSALFAVQATTGNGVRIDGLAGFNALSVGGEGIVNVDAPGVAGGRFIITNAGDVGINVPNPTAKFHVRSNVTAIRAETLAGLDAISIGGTGRLSIDALGVFGGRFLVTDNGLVGIGNDNPNFKLDIRSAINTSSNIRIDQIGADRTTGLRLDRDGSEYWFAGMFQNESNFTIRASGFANRVVVQPNGNVGIGTNNPVTGLHVSTPERAATGGGVFLSGGNGGNSAIEIRGGANPHIDFANDGAIDFDLRLIQDADNRIQLQGGQLFVNGFRNNDDYGNTGTFAENFVGTGDLGFATGFNPYSIRASNWVIGDVFASYSDRRIKKDFRIADNRASLTLLREIEVNHYKHIDFVQKGKKERMGFVAQQIEAVFPEAVTMMENTLPNIYQPANSATYDKETSTLTVSVNSDVSLKKGNQVQLFVDKDRTPRMVTLASVSGGSFVVNNWTEEVEQVFVYGTEVKDFKAVDYDRVFILGISAIQELDRKVSELENLKKDMSQMSRDIAELKAVLQMTSKN